MKRFVFPLAVLLALTAQAQAPAPAEILQQIEAVTLDGSGALRVEGVEVPIGDATLAIESATLFPATAVNGRIVEMVLLGKARVRYTPPDEIETYQLEVFTGNGKLDEPVDEAVLLVADDEAAQSLLGAPEATEVDETQRARAVELYAEWKQGAERKIVDAEGVMLLDALGEPYYAEVSLGRFHNEEMGNFLVAWHPNETEQVTLGQFVKPEVTEKEERKAERFLHKQQRKGRFVGMTVADLGTWDTWVSTASRDSRGRPQPGGPGYMPVAYDLDITIDDAVERIEGSAAITLRPTERAGRVIGLNLSNDYEVKAVRGAGAELFFRRGDDSLQVLLPQRSPDADVTIAVDYGGVAIEKLRNRLFSLRNTTGWYPSVSIEAERATYTMTLRYPKRLELIGSGSLVEQGDDGTLAWQKRSLDVPTFGVSFEIGDFEVRKFAAGVNNNIQIVMAFNAQSDDALKRIRDEIRDAIVDSMAFYEEKFGPYPLPYLTVVSAPRAYAQGLLGFVTLSDLMLTDDRGRLGLTDRRLIVAHEIAHQWWGNLVGWKSYRDDWISEAMANYAASAWAREKFRDLPEDEKPRITLTDDWQDPMTDVVRDGRRIESLGPVTLGRRLSSSLSDDAYEVIVYTKGAVVLNMLASAFGEETFLKLLREVTRHAGGKAIDTQDFLTILSKASGAGLNWFADQYLDRTGLPEVYYNYDISQSAEGKWQISGTARQQTPYTYGYAVVKTPAGRLDVARTAEQQIDVSDSRMSIPVQVTVVHPGKPMPPAPKGKKKKGKKGAAEPDKPRANATLEGRMLVKGERHEFTLPMPHRPVDVYFDHHERVFGRFFSENRAPRRVRYYKGLDASAEGNTDLALRLFGEALAMEPDKPAQEIEIVGSSRLARVLQAGLRDDLTDDIRYQIAWAQLDLGNLAAAKEQVDEMKKAAKGAFASNWLESRLRVMEGRIALLEGDADTAFKHLSKRNRKRVYFTSGAGYGLFAIAAHQTGNEQALKRALKAARRRGVDVALLEE